MEDLRTLAERAANVEAELGSLRLKSGGDDNTIALLKQQNADLANELTDVLNRHAIEMQRLRQERDLANSKAMQVGGIIDSMCKLGIDGMKKMREEPARSTPAAVVAAQVLVSEHPTAQAISDARSIAELSKSIPDRDEPPAEVRRFAPPQNRVPRLSSQPQDVDDHPLLPPRFISR